MTILPNIKPVICVALQGRCWFVILLGKKPFRILLALLKRFEAKTPNACLIFLANKVDLGNRIELGAQDLDNLSRSWGSPYLFTSAKTGEHVEDAFLLMADKVEQSS